MGAPMATNEISIAKALKVKNRLAGRLTKASEDIKTFNSVLPSQQGRADVLALVELRKRLAEAMIVIKTALSEAARPIRRDLFQLAELKGELQLLSNLDTTHGARVLEFYGSSSVQDYVATLKKADVDKATRALERQIDDLQDRIDQFNATHTVAIDSDVLDLAS